MDSLISQARESWVEWRQDEKCKTLPMGHPAVSSHSGLCGNSATTNLLFSCRYVAFCCHLFHCACVCLSWAVGKTAHTHTDQPWWQSAKWRASVRNGMLVNMGRLFLLFHTSLRAICSHSNLATSYHNQSSGVRVPMLAQLLQPIYCSCDPTNFGEKRKEEWKQAAHWWAEHSGSPTSHSPNSHQPWMKKIATL